MAIKAVLIDIDNTLLDFDACVKKAIEGGFEKFGLCSYDDSVFGVFQRVNSRLWQKIELGTMTYEELLEERWNIIFSELNASFDGRVFEEYFRKYIFESAIPVDGADEILVYLKERYILCVASNGPYAQQVNRLKKAGMLSDFSKLFISESIGFSKPSQEFFLHCLGELNAECGSQSEREIHPSEIVMIGDSLSSDMAGAITFGLKTCYFDKNKTQKTDGLPVDYVIDNLRDIRLFL